MQRTMKMATKTAKKLAAAVAVALCGCAMGVERAAQVADDSLNTAEAVIASFIAQDDGAIGKHDPAPRASKKVHISWDRPVREVAAELRAAELPTYYIADGRAVAMTVHDHRVVVRFAGSDAEAAARSRALGLPVLRVVPSGVDGYKVIELASAVVGGGGINAVLELLLTDGAFEFATPVFNSTVIEGGAIVMFPEINARVSEANIGRIDEVVGIHGKGTEIISRQHAGLEGAVQLRSNERNGFRVLKLANELALNTELAWAAPRMMTPIRWEAFTPNDPFFGTTSMWGWMNDGSGGGVADMDTDADLAWELTRGNPSVKVLVLDQGSEQTHPDINQNTGRNFTDGTAAGFGDGSPLNPCDNHGTAVAGVISGRINNALGGAGVCPNSRVISAKIGVDQVDAMGNCTGFWGASATIDDYVANALEWGESQGARISNSSYSTGAIDLITDSYDAKAAAGMINFCSAGNGTGGCNGIANNALSYPSSLASSQSVAAIGSNGVRTGFSNFGTGLDFSCPGTNVRTTDRTGAAGYNGTDYAAFCGTSASAPFASGIAAILISSFPDFDSSGIVNLMKFYATDLGTAGYDTGYGWGFPNINDAMRAVFPQNNWCQIATDIETSAYNPTPYSVGNAAEVPEELDEGCELNNAGVSHSVWYRFVPACDGTVSINTNGSDYDTVLSVWRGNCSNAAQVGCDDDGGAGTQSQIVGLSVAVGETYYIKIAAYGVNNAGGSLDFNFLYTPTALSNDQCSNAFDIPFNQLTLHTCTLGATAVPCEGSEPCLPAGVGSGHSVWFEFTTPSIGRFYLDTFGSGYDTVLSVWRGNCGTSFSSNGQTFCGSVPTNVACNDDSVSTRQSVLDSVPAQAFTTYRFKVAAYGNNDGGDTTFYFQFIPCPADFNLSGSVTVQDIFDFLAAYFAGDARADFNNWAGITVQDIFDFLAAYFGGPCN